MSFDKNSPYNARNHEGIAPDVQAALDASTAAMQATLIAFVTANSGRGPEDNETFVFETATGNLIWGSGGSTYIASMDFSDSRNSMYAGAI